MNHPILAKKSNLVLINKKGTSQLIDFAILASHGVNMKEKEKIDKYLDLARELKKRWKVIAIPIVAGALGMVP